MHQHLVCCDTIYTRMGVTRYHKFLRISAVVATLVLLFDGGFLSPITKTISDNTIQYLASSIGIGVGASVPPNEINVITAALTERERELDTREAALEARQIATRDFGTVESTNVSTYVLSV